MMIITNKQFSQLSGQKIEVFVQKSLVFLKGNFQQWIIGKDEIEMRRFIQNMIILGRKYNIVKEINIQKLMHYKIEYDFDLVRYKKLEEILYTPGMNEDAKIEKFYLYLESGIYKLIPITLQTDIAKFEKN